MRLVEILVLRPSRDLGKLAGEFEPRLPRAFRYITRGLGTRQTTSPDILSLLMFQIDYLRALVELGERTSRPTRIESTRFSLCSACATKRIFVRQRRPPLRGNTGRDPGGNLLARSNFRPVDCLAARCGMDGASVMCSTPARFKALW
jgi:hypothetical protein